MRIGAIKVPENGQTQLMDAALAQAGLARDAHEIRVHCDAWHPRQTVAGENQRPRVAILARDPRVDEDVLQLARAPSSRRPHAQTRPSESHSHMQVGFQMRRIRILAAVASPHVELRRAGAARPCRRPDNFHVVPHDTKTPAARKIDTAAANFPAGQLEHQSEVGARQGRQRRARAGVKELHHLNANCLWHLCHVPPGVNTGFDYSPSLALDGLLAGRGPLSGGIEPASDARAVALEGGQDLMTQARPRELQV